MFGDGNFIILMQGNVYASDICHPKGTSIRARCLVAVHPPLTVFLAPAAAGSRCNPCDFLLALRLQPPGRIAWRGAFLLPQNVVWWFPAWPWGRITWQNRHGMHPGGCERNHQGASLGRNLRACHEMCWYGHGVPTHEPEWPQHTCGMPPPQHYRRRNHLSSSFL